MKTKLQVSDCLCHNLRKASRLLTQYYDEALRDSGVRITQFTLIAAVQEMSETAFVPLAEFLGMDRTTLARNLELLQREGLVEIHAGETDRRQQIVQLTEAGQTRLAQAMPLWEKAQRRVMQNLSNAGLPHFLAELSELSDIQSK